MRHPSAPVAGLESVMRRAALALALVILAVSLPTAAADGTPPDILDPLLRNLSVRPVWGDPPPFSLSGLDGRTYSLVSVKGRALLLYFWATWCPICSKELPSTIEALHREFQDRGLVILAVSVQEPRDRVVAWVKERGLQVPVLLDTDGAVAQAYRATGTPTFVLMDPRSQLVGRGVGARDWTGEPGRALIQALLPPQPP
jgi:peroxiredoxin